MNWINQAVAGLVVLAPYLIIALISILIFVVPHIDSTWKDTISNIVSGMIGAATGGALASKLKGPAE